MIQRFRDRRPRPAWLALGIAASAIFSFAVAILVSLTDSDAQIPEATARAAVRRESQAATRIGLAGESTRAEPVTVQMTTTQFDLPMHAGDCAAVIAACSGGFEVRDIELTEVNAEGTLVTAEDTGGVSRHAQWCADHDTTWKAAIRIQRISPLADDASATGTVFTAVHRGRLADGILALDRARPTEATVRRVPTSTVVALSDRRAAQRAQLASDLTITGFRARLVPETTVTYAELHTLARNERDVVVSPAFDALPSDWPANLRPLATAEGPTSLAVLGAGLRIEDKVTHPALAFVSNLPRRVLAVVDSDALGGCVEIHFIRMLFGFQSHVSRYPESPLQLDRNLATDRVCPGTGRVAYVVLATDQEDYRMRLFAESVPRNGPRLPP